MDINSTSSIQQQLNNGDQTNKKIKLTPFIVVPPTSSFVKLEDNLLKGIGNHLNASNVNSISGVKHTTNSLTATNSSMNNLNTLTTLVNQQNANSVTSNATSTLLTTTNSGSFTNGQIMVASKPGDMKANYVMLNGIGTNVMNQFIDNNQARSQVNSICINKLPSSSAQTNGTTTNCISTTTNGGLISSSATSNNQSSSNQATIENLNNKVSVQYLSVSYNNSGNISITTPSNSNLVNTNGNSITINSSELQQQILNTLKSSFNTTTQQSHSNLKQGQQTTTVTSGGIINNSSINGPNNSTNCDQPANQISQLEDCQLTLHCTNSPATTVPSMTITTNTSSSNQNTHNIDHTIDDKQTVQQRIEIQNSPLNEGALNDFDIKTLNSHNLLATTNRLLISPTDFLTLTEDHNNNVSSNQTPNYNSMARNSAVKRDVSLSSGCLSSSVELLRKSSSSYLNSLNNNFIGFERFCESPLFIDHHRDLLDDDDELKDVNKEFINSEDLFFGTSLSDNQHLDQSQLDQLVFILDHQQPEQQSNDLSTNSTFDHQINQPNNCFVILDINQQQQQSNGNNKVTIKTEPNQSFNSNNVQPTTSSSLNNGNSVLLNCLTSTNNLLNKTTLCNSNTDNLLQVTANTDSGSTKIIDGIKYIIHQNSDVKSEKPSVMNTQKDNNNLIKINNLPAYLTNANNLIENGQFIVNMNSNDKQLNSSKLQNSGSDSSLATSTVLIQHTGRNNNRQVNKVNGNLNGNMKGNSAIIKSQLNEPIFQTELPNLKTEKSDNLTSSDIDLSNLFGKTTAINVSVSSAEETVSSTTNNTHSLKSNKSVSPDSSTLIGQLNKQPSSDTNSSFVFQNSNSANLAGNPATTTMTILANGDTNSSTNSNSTTSTQQLANCQTALVATTPNNGNAATNNSTYTLLPTGLLQLAANIAAVFPSSNVQKQQVALQLLREDGTSIIVNVPITAPNRQTTNSTQNSPANSTTSNSNQLSAISQDGSNVMLGSTNTIHQTSTLPQATQLITISADSLNNLMQGGLNGNVVATITTGQTTNPAMITTLGTSTATTTSSTTSITASDQACPDRPFKCELCSSTFTRLGNFTRHKKIHSLPSKDQRFKCDICEKSFIQRCDLARHLHIHRGTEPHRCSMCGKGYIRHSDLVTHQRFHNKEKPFACPHCTKGFCQRGDLNRHLRSIHLQLKPILCTHCSKKFAKQETLLRHINANHR